MPMNKDRYPPDWDAIALAVKERCGWVCQDCHRQCRRPGERFDTHRRTLTVSHANHDEADCRTENLIPRCAPCHLRYDAQHHAENAARTRRSKKIAAGQAELGLEG